MNDKFNIFLKARYIYCKFLKKLSDLKYIFQLNINGYDYSNSNFWIIIVNLIDEVDNIYEVEYIIDCKKLNEMLELEKSQKYLFYKKGVYSCYKNNTIIIFDSISPYNVTYKDFDTNWIDTLFKLDNCKNTIFIFMAKPLLNLYLFNYNLIQVDTIIDLINPVIPLEMYYDYRPFIYEIKDLKNKKLLFYGSQLFTEYYWIEIKEYDIKIIFDYEELNIEFAENISYYDDFAWE